MPVPNRGKTGTGTGCRIYPASAIWCDRGTDGVGRSPDNPAAAVAGVGRRRQQHRMDLLTACVRNHQRGQGGSSLTVNTFSLLYAADRIAWSMRFCRRSRPGSS